MSRYPRWLWIFALAALLLTTLPYLLGFAVQGNDWRFSGFVFGVEDGHSYMAKMLRGAAGNWLFETPYTALEQGGVLAFFPYILLGKLSAPPGQYEQLVVLFQVFRWVGGLMLFMALYDFIRLFIADESWRRWGVALASLGGGLGWMLILLGKGSWLGSLPLDLYSPETFGFLALLGLPHLLVARAMLLWGFVAYLNPESAPWRAGFIWLWMGFFQPLNVPLAWVLVAAHWLVVYARDVWQLRGEPSTSLTWQIWLRRALGAAAVSAPLVIYTFSAFNADPVLRQWTAQNLILSPHPLQYLAAYGLLMPLSLMGLRRVWRNWTQLAALLVVWTLALPLLVYAPYNLQRRLAEGFWVAWVVLALLALDRRPPTQRRESTNFCGLCLRAFVIKLRQSSSG